jgi:hypothetical protein
MGQTHLNQDAHNQEQCLALCFTLCLPVLQSQMNILREFWSVSVGRNSDKVGRDTKGLNAVSMNRMGFLQLCWLLM